MFVFPVFQAGKIFLFLAFHSQIFFCKFLIQASSSENCIYYQKDKPALEHALIQALSSDSRKRFTELTMLADYLLTVFYH